MQTELSSNFLVVTAEEVAPFICKTAKGVSFVFEKNYKLLATLF